MNAAAIEKIFKDTREAVKGLQGLLLITDDGFPIVTTFETGDRETRSTAVGAILCDAGQRGMKELALGELDAVIVTGDKGYFVITRVREGMLLMAVAERDVALGMVLLKIKKAKPVVLDALDASA